MRSEKTACGEMPVEKCLHFIFPWVPATCLVGRSIKDVCHRLKAYSLLTVQLCIFLPVVPSFCYILCSHIATWFIKGRSQQSPTALLKGTGKLPPTKLPLAVVQPLVGFRSTAHYFECTAEFHSYGMTLLCWYKLPAANLMMCFAHH